MTKRYEAMFIVDSTLAAKDFAGVRTHIHQILEKNGAEILASDRWDERRLAYDIRGVKRGTYILTYFLAPPEKVVEANHSLEMSDVVLRHMILQRDQPIEPPRDRPVEMGEDEMHEDEYAYDADEFERDR